MFEIFYTAKGKRDYTTHTYADTQIWERTWQHRDNILENSRMQTSLTNLEKSTISNDVDNIIFIATSKASLILR